MENAAKFSSTLTYSRCSEQGYTRKAKGRGFAYYLGHDLIKDKVLLKRFKSLGIPPAWKNVWICKKTHGHLQATGIDAKGRKQYLYHPQWSEMRKRNKFDKIVDFGKALPVLRDKIQKDSRSKELSKQKVVAIALELMEETLIRAGNAHYRDENKSYGLTTLQNKHVKIIGSEIAFNFRGKKGVLHKISLKDRALAKQLTKIKEIPGQQLFQYFDRHGSSCPIDSGDLNEYIQASTQQDFTSKDFRTWYGTLWAFRKLGEMVPFENQSQCNQNLNEMYDFVASKLGNTPAICKKHYVADSLIQGYTEKTAFIFFKKALRKGGKASSTQKAEKQLLNLLTSLSS